MSFLIGEKPVVALYSGDLVIGRLMAGDGYVWPAEPPSARRTTYLYLTLPDSARSKTLYYYQSAANAVEIDWGDGSAVETKASSGAVNLSHTYAAAGSYIVQLTVAENALWSPSPGYESIFGIWSGKSDTSPELTAVRLSDEGITFDDGYGAVAFQNCVSLEAIRLPACVDRVPDYFANGCTGITTIRLPNSIDLIEYYAFQNCTSFGPNYELRAGEIQYGAFGGCTALRKIWLRDTVETMTVTTTSSSGTVTARKGPFAGCSDQLVIYCEAASKPAGWDEYWDVRTGTDTRHTVVWGQTTRPW